MPMLRGCNFPDCETLTLGAYCLEHELFIRAETEAERKQGPEATSQEIGAPSSAATA
jgi:hypothetical protein